MIHFFKVKIEMDHQTEIKMQLSSIEVALTGFFDKLDVISQDLNNNEMVIETLYEKNEENRNKTYQALYASTSELRKVAQFELYSVGGICKYSTSTRAINTKLPTYWGILKAAADLPDALVMRGENKYASNSKDILLRSARTINDNQGNCIGYIVVGMRSADFDSLLSDTYSPQDSIVILDGQWDTIYSTESATEKSIGPALREQLMKGGALTDLSKECKFYISPIGSTGLYVALQRDEVFTTDISRTMYTVCAIMTLFSLMLCIGVSIRLSNSLAEPIHTITEAMHEVEKGYLDTRIETERIDEFGGLAIKFNTMSGKLRDNVERQVKQQQELNDSNIAMMQAQLNPHFIYNTLDTIKWVAKANNIPEVSTLVASLAKILRTSISSKHFITLKEELTLTQCYVDIQRIRFGERFTYVAEIQNDLEKCIVPKIVIQPLVENAIIHGLADRDDGNIYINVCKEKEKLLISVSDDGCGMSEEIMDCLNSRDRNRLAEHIGFYNVDTIIRLRYGDEFGVTVDAIENGGTKVTVVLPVIRGEATDHA
jgi:two-component system sensor histidine kinase YesM